MKKMTCRPMYDTSLHHLVCQMMSRLMCWFYWLNTISSSMITFSLFLARSVFGYRASVLAIFESSYFTR